MYIPKYFEEPDRKEIERLIKEFPFATLVAVKEQLPVAVHIPLTLVVGETGEWVLTGHMSKANPVWKCFSAEQQVLAIFMGPHAYVSPTWYNHKNVPTWNYRAVHLYGNATLLQGEKLTAMLSSMMDHYEHIHAENPYKMEDVPPSILEKDLNGLVGFEIKVDRIDAVSKLSQNRDAESYRTIIEHLENSDAYDSKRVAEEMEKRKNKISNQ